MAWREVGTDVVLLPWCEGTFSAAAAMFKDDPGVAWDFLAQGDEARVYEQVDVLDKDSSQRDGWMSVAGRDLTCWLPAFPESPGWRVGEILVAMARGPRVDFLGACLVMRVKLAGAASWALDLATSGPFLIAPRVTTSAGW
jgi:hypothetical protein